MSSGLSEDCFQPMLRLVAGIQPYFSLISAAACFCRVSGSLSCQAVAFWCEPPEGPLLLLPNISEYGLLVLDSELTQDIAVFCKFELRIARLSAACDVAHGDANADAADVDDGGGHDDDDNDDDDDDASLSIS